MGFYFPYQKIRYFYWSGLPAGNDLCVQCSLWYCSEVEFMAIYPDYPYNDRKKYSSVEYWGQGKNLYNGTRGYGLIRYIDGTSTPIPVPNENFEAYINWGLEQWLENKQYVEQHYINPYIPGKTTPADPTTK